MRVEGSAPGGERARGAVNSDATCWAGQRPAGPGSRGDGELLRWARCQASCPSRFRPDECGLSLARAAQSWLVASSMGGSGIL